MAKKANSSNHPPIIAPPVLSDSIVDPLLGIPGEGNSWESAFNAFVDKRLQHVSEFSEEARTHEVALSSAAGNILACFLDYRRSGPSHVNQGEKVIKVIVTKKSDAAAEGLNLSAPFKHEGKEYPFDVEEGRIFLLQQPEPMGWFPPEKVPFRCGYSIGVKGKNGTGTFGALVQLDEGHFCLLSNNHVIGGSDGGTVGDIIVAPGPADTTLVPTVEIGKLFRKVPLDFQGGINLVDAAVAHIDHTRVSTEYLGIQKPVNPDYVSAKEGMLVRKAGRTTGLTFGEVTSLLGVVPNLEYIVNGVKRYASFRRQIVIQGLGEPFSKPGDSGSLVMDHLNRPVGLLFAGAITSSGVSYTFANQIIEVMTQLKINRFLDKFP